MYPIPMTTTPHRRRLAPGAIWGLLVFFLTCLVPTCASAGIVILSEGQDDDTARVSIAGDWARIDHDDWPIYMLIDLQHGHVYAISPSERQIVDLMTPPPPPSQHAAEAIAKVGQPEARLERLGDGPTIAGFQTTRYRVSIDDTVCYDEYLALEPLQNPQIRRFVRALSRASQTEADTALEIAIDPSTLCEAADNLVDDQYPTLGIPMRTVARDQSIIHRITAIRETDDFATNFFALPAGYRHLTRQQAQQQAQARLDPNAPDVMSRQQAIERIIEHHGHPAARPESSTAGPDAPDRSAPLEP